MEGGAGKPLSQAGGCHCSVSMGCIILNWSCTILGGMETAAVQGSGGGTKYSCVCSAGSFCCTQLCQFAWVTPQEVQYMNIVSDTTSMYCFSSFPQSNCLFLNIPVAPFELLCATSTH